MWLHKFFQLTHFGRDDDLCIPYSSSASPWPLFHHLMGVAVYLLLVADLKGQKQLGHEFPFGDLLAKSLFL